MNLEKRQIYDEIKQIYLQPGDVELTVDITGIFTSRQLDAGLIPASFPLPAGKTWGKAQSLRSGEQLKRVEMTLRRLTGKVTLEFRGYA